MSVEHFNELVNSDVPTEGQQTECGLNNRVEEKAPNDNEIRRLLGNMKNNKSPEDDNITTEVFKYCGEHLLEHVHKLIKKIWIQEKLTCDWSEAVLF